MRQKMDLSRELDFATRIAREAAAEILRVRAGARLSAQQKAGDQGPVTEADLAADRVLYAGLSEAFPDDLIVTEERWQVGEDIAADGRTWFVDPLDGTEEFIRGYPDYAVMIGLVLEGRPALGVVAQPETGQVWRGVCVGEPRCERIDPDGQPVPLRVDDGRALPKAGPRAAVSRSHPSKLVEQVASELGLQVVKKGSVGLKIALIIDGGADLYVSASRRIKVWDTAGPRALLEAAGGEMTALDGSPLGYQGPAAHPAGVRAWTPAASGAVGGRLEAALSAWRTSSR